MNFEGAERDQSEPGDSQHPAPIALAFQGLQDAGNADHFAGIEIVGGHAEEDPDHEKHKGACHHTERSDRDHPGERHPLLIEFVPIGRAHDLDRKPDCDADQDHRKRSNHVAAERLAHQPMRPTARGLVLGRRARCEGHARRRRGEGKIEGAGARKRRPAHQAIGTIAERIGIEEGLQEAPPGETAEARGHGPQRKAAERQIEGRLQRIAHALRALGRAAGREQCQAADNKEDYAAGDIADPRHPRDRLGIGNRVGNRVGNLIGNCGFGPGPHAMTNNGVAVSSMPDQRRSRPLSRNRIFHIRRAALPIKRVIGNNAATPGQRQNCIADDLVFAR